MLERGGVRQSNIILVPFEGLSVFLESDVNGILPSDVVNANSIWGVCAMSLL